MKLEPKANCPLDNFNPCRKLDCAWFMEINGTHPQSGEPLKEWGCSMSWLPILLINSAKEQHSTSAAVESFRNEMVKSNEIGHNILLAAAHSNQPKPGQTFLEITNE
jgi:hypothetical protein